MKNFSIKKVKFSYIPLSNGKLSVGASVELSNGILEWDACPIGTTSTKLDPICLGIDFLEDMECRCNNKLSGKNVLLQTELDNIIEELFKSQEYGFNGVDYSISLSCAIARAASIYKHTPLFKYVSLLSKTKCGIPKILSNVIGGGGHHENDNKVTEIMVLGSNNAEIDIKKVLQIRDSIKTIFMQKNINSYTGLEGCLVPDIMNEYQLIEKLSALLSDTNLKIGLDLAGIYDENLLRELLNTFPIIGYIEDPYSDNNIVNKVFLN